MVTNKDTIIYKLDANPTTASSKKKTNIKISIINILYLSIIHKFKFAKIYFCKFKFMNYRKIEDIYYGYFYVCFFLT